jgi:hypothetical protein
MLKKILMVSLVNRLIHSVCIDQSILHSNLSLGIPDRGYALDWLSMLKRTLMVRLSFSRA